MKTSTYTVNGLTCEACVKTVSENVSVLPGVKAVKVDLNNKTIAIQAARNVEHDEVVAALQALPKYQVSAFSKTTDPVPISPASQDPFYKIYKPLMVIFTYILGASFAFQIKLGHFDPHIFKDHLMAGFFIGFSFFKFLDLKKFSESFSGYDPLAQRWPTYGYIYPFIELILGILFIAGKALSFANGLTVIVLTITTFGVYKRLQSKSQFQCACLGTAFNLPLSNITIAENVVMILMAVYSLVS